MLFVVKQIERILDWYPWITCGEYPVLSLPPAPFPRWSRERDSDNDGVTDHGGSGGHAGDAAAPGDPRWTNRRRVDGVEGESQRPAHSIPEREAPGGRVRPMVDVEARSTHWPSL
jgi:hypothetical protein